MTRDEITCVEFVELVTDYFEGALEDPTLSRVEEHLVVCDLCVTYAEQLKDTVAALGALPSDVVPSELTAAVREAVREQTVRDAGPRSIEP